MKKILIIEDNVANMKLFRMILRRMQCETYEAFDGEAGVIQARTLKPDLILMDIQLPIIDGVEAFHRIRSDPITQNIPIIALTSYAMKGDEDHLSSLGFNAYLAKPISKESFTKTIQRFL